MLGPVSFKLRYAVALAIFTMVAGCGGGQTKDRGRVVIGLDFMPNAVHAPLYMAVKERFDRRRGIRISVRTPGSGPDSLRLLIAGRADIGVLDIDDLALARERGADLVGIAALVQRPLAAIIAQPPIGRPRDLEGRLVGVSGLPSDPAFLRAIVARDGGDYSKVRQTTIGFAAVGNMLARKIAAVPAFWNAEGVVLRQRGIDVKEFRVDSYGAPQYPEVVLAATRSSLERRGVAIRHALEAIRDGLGATITNPSKATDAVAQASGSADQRLVRAQLDAVSPALRPALRLNGKVLERWAAFAARVGLLAKAPDIRRMFDLSFLPSARQSPT